MLLNRVRFVGFQLPFFVEGVGLNGLLQSSSSPDFVDICGLLRAIDLRCVSSDYIAVLPFVSGSHLSSESSALHAGGVCPLSNGCLAGRKMIATLQGGLERFLLVCLPVVEHPMDTGEFLFRFVELVLDRLLLVDQ